MSVVENKAAIANFADGVVLYDINKNEFNEEDAKNNETRKRILVLKIALVVVSVVAAVLLCLTIWGLATRGKQPEPLNLGFIQASAAISSNLDETVDPCQNFAQYACGGWMKKNVIPDDSDQVSNFEKLREETNVKLYNLLTGFQESKDTKPDYLNKLVDFYTSCTNTDKMDNAPDEEDVVKRTVTSIMDAADKTEVIKIVAPYDIDVFYVLYVDADNRNPDVNAIYMMQGALGLRLKSEYNNTNPDEKTVERQGYYKKYLKGLWENYDPSLPLDDIVTMIWDFESCAAEGMKIPEEERAAFQSMPNKTYIDVLTQDFANPLFFEDQVVTRMSEGKTPVPDVNVFYHDSYVSKLESCVTDHLTDLEDFKRYVATRYMLFYAYSAKESWRELAWTYSKEITKVAVKPPRWKACVQTMTSYLPECVGRVFVEENFKEEAKKKTLSMIEDIKGAFREILPSLDWMDDETRAAAIEKADMVANKIGYEDWILDNEQLNEYVRLMVMDSEDLLTSTMSGDRALTVRNFDSAGHEVNKKKWYMSPAIVNAYYSPKGNEMVFPAAILQPPFYSMNYPNYVNYGAIGVVIGHELTHGFDDQGRQYDKYGHLKEWYTDLAKEGFEERSKCMVDQYNNYEILGNKVNGNLTLGENIADNGGVKQSFTAYQNWVERNGPEHPLPGLNITNEQAFFISYAQLWCQKKTKEAFDRMTALDPHSPGVFRVNGAVENSKEFSQAFNCKKGDPMNPDGKCEVW